MSDKTVEALAEQLAQDMVSFIHSPSYSDEDFIKQATAIGANLIGRHDAEVRAAAWGAAREQAAKLCDSRAEMRDKYECGCRGYTQASEHNAEEIRSLAPPAEVGEWLAAVCKEAFELGAAEYKLKNIRQADKYEELLMDLRKTIEQENANEREHDERIEAQARLEEAKWWRYLVQMHEESYFAVEGDKRIADLQARLAPHST